MSAPPVKITGGTLTGDGIAAHIDGKTGAVELSCDPLALHAYLCLQMDGLQPNWDAWVVDETLPAPNWCQVVKTEGTAYVVLPCDSKKRYFLGHPVTADNPQVKISLCNILPHQWVISLHNPDRYPDQNAH